MRIKYVIPPNVHPGYVNAKMGQTLRQELSTCEGIEVVDQMPDIVHVFGIWNNSCAKLVGRYRNIDVPVIFTSTNGILSLVGAECHATNNLATKSALRRICKMGTTIHVGGKMEESIVNDIAKSAKTHTISNALLSATTDVRAMTSQFLSLYKSTCETNDRNTKERIAATVDKALASDDTTIATICSRIMYIRQRFIMHNIPQAYLDETSRLMTASDYDEDNMKTTLRNLHLYKFASCVMALLNDCSTLTEGFMPIESNGGKMVDNMKKYIIQ